MTTSPVQVRGEALDRRYSGYAAKFVNECDGPPTDKNLRKVLAQCVRPARAAEYELIRPHVTTFRVTRMLEVITAAQIPGLHNLRAGRLDDGPMVHFDVGDRLQGGAGTSQVQYLVALGVRLTDDDGAVTRQTMTAGTARCGTIAEVGPALTSLVRDVRNRLSDL